MKSDINVTPLVDVVLVLLIIFMVVTPMMQQGQAVQLPIAGKSPDEPPRQPLVLSLTSERTLYVQSDAYADPSRFQSRLQEELSRQPERRLLLKADQRLSCGDVREALRLARTAGAKNVSLGIEERQD